MFLPSLLLLAADWSQFRGPNASGVATGAVVTEFGPHKNVVWKTALPMGKSSPALAGDRIYVSGWDADRLLTLALDRASGRVLWRREIRAPRSEVLHKLNEPSSASPVSDGSNVYVFFGNFGLVSYGPDGNERWRIPLGPFTNLHGMAASPVLAGGKVLLVCDQDSGSFLLAVDRDTGRVAWKVERDTPHGFS
ncbi:MAG: PQQ-binding-like beta-propeller repeat protein, partial [Bryobacteraceae bacterium]